MIDKPLELPDVPLVRIIIPARTARVHFGDGKIIPMNRSARRKQHLYGSNVQRMKPS